MIIQEGKELLEQDKKKSNMILRILSAFVIGPLFIISIMWFAPLFYILMLLVLIGMLYEWYNMTKSSRLYLLIGLIILPLPVLSLIYLRTNDTNQWLLLLYFAIIWSVDTFAMIGGKNIGGLKLAPRISPNKTWSGLIVGVVSSSFISFCLSYVPGFNIDNYYFSSKDYLIMTSFCLSLIAQMSDLFISYFKRKFAIKDSGTIIPGHGGVLDRFDSIILTAPILFFIINI